MRFKMVIFMKDYACFEISKNFFMPIEIRILIRAIGKGPELVEPKDA